MALQWTDPITEKRDDNPYHAWSFNTYQGAKERYVPVFLQLLPKGDLKTLLKSAETLEGLIDGKDYVLPSDEERVLASLKSSIKTSLNANASHCDDSLYTRLVLIYARESKISSLETPHFTAWFIGSAIGTSLGASATQVPTKRQDKSAGSSVLTIIDDSFAFLNDALTTSHATKKGTRTSRFQNILFQSQDPLEGDQLTTRFEISTREINDLLQDTKSVSEAQLYQRPITKKGGGSYTPLDLNTEAHQPLGFPISHGTHVTDTALSTFDDENPNADPTDLKLFGITIPTTVTQDTSGQTLGTYILIALRQAMLWADQFEDAPLVVNFSYGFTGGPKDGSSKLNQCIAALLESRNALARPSALIVPMGNAAYSQTVLKANLKPNEKTSVMWVLQPDDGTENFLEIFGDNGDIAVTLTPPSEGVPEIEFTLDKATQPHSRHLINGTEKTIVASFSNWPLERSSDWNRHGFIALGATKSADSDIPAGVWQVEIKNLNKTKPVNIEAYIQRDDASGSFPALGRQSYFEHADVNKDRDVFADPGKTHAGGPITVEKTASVFAYIDSKYVYSVGAGIIEGESCIASPYASYGPISADQDGPDFIAQADRSQVRSGIFATGTYSGSRVLMSGSSVASPQIAGFLAAHPHNIGQAAEEWTKTIQAQPSEGGRVSVRLP